GWGAGAPGATGGGGVAAYIIGMVLAGTVGKDHALIRRLRTLTFGLLTPFYFIRAGSFVSVPELVAAPAAFIVMLVLKVFSKIVGVYPVTKIYKAPNKEAMYTTLLMSTGLTFGTISALFGLSRGIIEGPILGAGCRRHCERGHSDGHCQRLLSAAPLVARAATGAGSTADAAAHHVGERLSDCGRARMFDKILHANDGSEHAFHALALALAVAQQNNSELHMISVEEIDYMPAFIEEVREETGTAARRFHSVLQRARAMAQEHGVKLHTHVVAGHPVRDIVGLAAELKVDLLVIGATGHSALYERMIGSRADRIMQIAPCPVLVVK